jgi:two-component system nitrogen regulation response regulator GlnG
MSLLMHFQFPGNVRQLENVCHWLTVMAPAQVIEPKDLPPEVAMSAPLKGDTLPTQSVIDGNPVGLPTEAIEPLGMAMPVAVSESRAAVPASPAVPAIGEGVTPVVLNMPGADWENGLEAEAMALLASGRTDVWDVLSRRFEGRLIATALVNTRGRRIEAAHKLGIGRNTITRKIQELGLE